MQSSYLRLIDFCITQLKAQGPSRTCNESKEAEEVRGLGPDGGGCVQSVGNHARPGSQGQNLILTVLFALSSLVVQSVGKAKPDMEGQVSPSPSLSHTHSLNHYLPLSQTLPRSHADTHSLTHWQMARVAATYMAAPLSTRHVLFTVF